MNTAIDAATCAGEWSFWYGCCEPGESKVRCILREIKRVYRLPTSTQEYIHFTYFILLFLMSYGTFVSWQNSKDNGEDNE